MKQKYIKKPRKISPFIFFLNTAFYGSLIAKVTGGTGPYTYARSTVLTIK